MAMQRRAKGEKGKKKTKKSRKAGGGKGEGGADDARTQRASDEELGDRDGDDDENGYESPPLTGEGAEEGNGSGDGGGSGNDGLEEMSEYDKLRQKNIEERQRKFHELKLNEAKSTLR